MAHSIKGSRHKNALAGYTCFKDIGHKNGRRNMQALTRHQQTNIEKRRTKRILRMAGWQKNIIQTVWGAMINLWKLCNDE
jgi:hypothetical protein